MDTINRIYCRANQNAVRLVTPFLPYRTPLVLNSIKNISKIFKKENCSNALIVTGPIVSELGLLYPLTEALTKCGVKYSVYSKTSSNPTISNVEDAYSIYLKDKCDSIIGFGGGSNIDCAKAVGAKAARPDLNISEMNGILKLRRKLPLLIAIPTTAGSGSETTPVLVISDTDKNLKYPIDDYMLVPKYAVLDASTNVSLPPFATATSGMDALTHAVEAYIGRSTTYGSGKDALLAVRLIFENIDKAFTDGSDLNARKNMLHASYYAGCAISRSFVGYIHAVSHTLGGEYNVPHGLANAVLLPFVLETYGEIIHKKLKELALAADVAEKTDSEKDAACKFIKAVKDMKKRFGIGDCIPEIREEDIPRLACLAAAEANPLYPVPVLMNAKELERYYYQILPADLPDYDCK